MYVNVPSLKQWIAPKQERNRLNGVPLMDSGNINLKANDMLSFPFCQCFYGNNLGPSPLLFKMLKFRDDQRWKLPKNTAINMHRGDSGDACVPKKTVSIFGFSRWIAGKCDRLIALLSLKTVETWRQHVFPTLAQVATLGYGLPYVPISHGIVPETFLWQAELLFFRMKEKISSVFNFEGNSKILTEHANRFQQYVFFLI